MTIDNLISIMVSEIKGLELSNDNATLKNGEKRRISPRGIFVQR